MSSFLGPVASRILTIVVISLIIVGFCCITLPLSVACYRQTMDIATCTATNVFDGDLPFSRNLEVSGCNKLCEEPVIVLDGESESEWVYLPVAIRNFDPQETGEDGFKVENRNQDAVVLVARLHQDEHPEIDISELAESGTIHGLFYDQGICEEAYKQLDEDFPGVDFRNCAVINVADKGSNLILLCIGFMTFYLLAIVGYLIYSTSVYITKDRMWRARISEDRAHEYREHQPAMQLCGASEFSTSEIYRNVDHTWEPPQPETNSGKTRTWLWKSVAFACSVAVYMLISMSIESIGYLAEQSPMMIAGVALAGLSILGVLFKSLSSIQKKGPAMSEKQLSERRCAFKKSGFLAWHRNALNELGFEELGDFKAVNIAHSMVRTIFISRQRNLIAEVGVQAALGEFFTFESFLNNSTFVETHSLMPKISERLPLPGTSGVMAVRQSAKDMTMLEALDAHERLVTQFTSAAQLREGGVSADNFAAALSWANTLNTTGKQLWNASPIPQS